MYKSPIDVMIADIQHQIAKQQDEEIYKAVVSVGINVDKAELLRALEYDRQQYERGYAYGLRDSAPKWIPVTERLPTIEDATEKGAVLAWEVSVKHWDIWAWDCVRDYPDRFIGWMPLPEAPKGE